MDNFPCPALFDEDQGGPCFLFDSAGSCLEAVVENEGGDPNVAEDVDLQVFRLHREFIGGTQSVVLALARNGGVLSAGCFRGKLGKFRAVKVIPIQPIEILFLRGIKDFIQAAANLRLLLRMFRRQFGCGRSRASNKKDSNNWQELT